MLDFQHFSKLATKFEILKYIKKLSEDFLYDNYLQQLQVDSALPFDQFDQSHRDAFLRLKLRCANSRIPLRHEPQAQPLPALTAPLETVIQSLHQQFEQRTHELRQLKADLLATESALKTQIGKSLDSANKTSSNALTITIKQTSDEFQQKLKELESKVNKAASDVLCASV